ncbi:HK97-gp10 family putative phage morphogenesis protein [Sporolactobacillus sp. KGMB 08714]|uniref:HK97-gp10 family putative phage morphogenesis protein n=1 Tax=Sporolactobacillus sp. KGMB 08714 TaxID=3064704 RepID=UPI002FBE5F7B
MAKGGITQFGDKKFELAIDRFEQKYISEIKRIVAETAEMIVSIAKTNAPVNTGYLKEHIKADYSNDGLTAVVYVDASYAVYVEFGTVPHIIKPKKKKALFWEGADNPVKEVHHPGTKAQHFWVPAYEKAAQHFKSEMNKLG